jgi:hypothetical protein
MRTFASADKAVSGPTSAKDNIIKFSSLNITGGHLMSAHVLTTCQLKKLFHMPKYVIGVVTPAMSGTSYFFSKHPSRSLKFQP